jgi:cell division protein FtsB
MRRINPKTRVGKVNMPAPFSKEFALLVVLAGVIGWVVVGFTQEVLLTHQLSAQAASLRQQNAGISAANNGYRRDIQVSGAGATVDEDARAHGYARSDEKVYVVGGPNPAPTAPPPKPVVKVEGSQIGIWQQLGRWIGNLWHR